MTQRNECVDLVINELERYGLRGEVAERGKHLEVAWSTPHGRRFVIVAKTPSDWRASLNTRSDLRKMLRADNLQPKQISELSFQKAMSLPKQIITTEHILQKDVNELTDLMFDMQLQMIALQDKLTSMQVVSKVEFVKEPFVEDKEIKEAVEHLVSEGKVIPQFQDNNPFRSDSKQYRIYNCLTAQFKHTSEIISKAGYDAKYVHNTLHKAKKMGLVETGLRGQYRRKS